MSVDLTPKEMYAVLDLLRDEPPTEMVRRLRKKMKRPARAHPRRAE